MLALGIIGAVFGVLLITWALRKPELGIRPQPKDTIPFPEESEPLNRDKHGRLRDSSGRFVRE